MSGFSAQLPVSTSAWLLHMPRMEGQEAGAEPPAASMAESGKALGCLPAGLPRGCRRNGRLYCLAIFLDCTYC